MYNNIATVFFHKVEVLYSFLFLDSRFAICGFL